MAFFAVRKQNGSADELRTDIQNWATSKSTRTQPSSKQVSNNGLKGEQDTRALVPTISQLCVRFRCPTVLKNCIKHGGITAALCAKFQNEQLSNKLCLNVTSRDFHDDVIKWKHFPRYWPFVRGIHRSPVNSPHKGHWRGTLMFSLICARFGRTSYIAQRPTG